MELQFGSVEVQSVSVRHSTQAPLLEEEQKGRAENFPEQRVETEEVEQPIQVLDPVEQSGNAGVKQNELSVHSTHVFELEHASFPAVKQFPLVKHPTQAPAVLQYGYVPEYFDEQIDGDVVQETQVFEEEQ